MHLSDIGKPKVTDVTKYILIGAEKQAKRGVLGSFLEVVTF